MLKVIFALNKLVANCIFLSIKYGCGASNEDSVAGNDDVGARSLVLTVPFSFTGFFRRGFINLLHEKM